MNVPPAPDPKTIAAARKVVARLAGRYPVSKALLFGSRARGDARQDSDVDVAFVLNGPKGKAVEVGPEMASDAFDVMLETGLFISPLPIWEADWRDPTTHSNPWLIRNIQREGVAL